MDTLNQLIDKLLTIEIDCHLIGKIFELISILIRIFYQFIIIDGYTLNQFFDKVFGKLLTIKIGYHL